MHEPSEEKSGDSKSTYHMKILLGVFNTKWRVEDIFKLTFANENLHQDSTDNSVKIVNFTT
jgi:hypothetical protein